MRVSLTLFLSIAATTAWGQVSSGTAFSVAPGLLVTNHHVIERCIEIEVIAQDGRRPATVVDAEPTIDLALLRVFGLRGGIAQIRRPSDVRLGEEVMVFGYPLAGALSSAGNFTTGVVSAVRGLRNSANEIQITAPIQPGSSGGPVMDQSGLVIGVVEAKLDAIHSAVATGDIPQNVNFAIALAVLTDFLTKNEVRYRGAPRGQAVAGDRVAEQAQTFTYRVECRQRIQQATAPVPEQARPTVVVEDPKFLGLAFGETAYGLAVARILTLDLAYTTDLAVGDEVVDCSVVRPDGVRQSYPVRSVEDIKRDCFLVFEVYLQTHRVTQPNRTAPTLFFKVRQFGREVVRRIAISGH